MNWEVINTLVAVLTLAFTIFLEWPRVKERVSLPSLKVSPLPKSDSPAIKPAPKPSFNLPANLKISSLMFWVVWSTLGFVCAFALGIWQDRSTFQNEILLVIPSAFALLGFSQWLLIRKHLLNSNWWIIASTFPVFILVLIGGGNSLTLFMIGLAQGFSQWLILKSNFQKANIWWIASATSWPLGIYLAFLIPDNIRPFYLYPLEVGVIIYEATQGALFVWLLGKDRIQKKTTTPSNKEN